MHLTPGDPLNLTEKQRKLLGPKLQNLVTDLEDTYSPLFKDIKTWWDWYEAKPRMKVKNFPFVNAPLSRDTEVLSRDGWRPVSELCVGDMVLTRRDEDGAQQWKPVLATPSVWADQLLHFQSNSFDQLVTPEHTMVCYHPYDKRVCRRSAEDLFGTTGYRAVLTGSPFQGSKPDELFGMPAADAMELLGWYLSEGWHNTSYYDTGTVSKGTIFIGQSRSANPENCRRLEALFGRLGIGWKQVKSNEAYSLSARDIPMEFRKHIYEQGISHEKFVPRFVFDLHADLIWRLLDGLVFGDGSISYQAKNGYWGAVSFSSTSRRLADDVQALVALAGYRATIHETAACDGGSIKGRRISGQRAIHCVRFLSRDRAKLERCSQTIEPYNDFAFCVTVENHAIYIRRNGVPSWTGNSNIVVPLSQIMVDALVNKTSAALFGVGRRIWMGYTENELEERLVDNVVRHLNWAANNNDFDFRLQGYDWLLECAAIGSSVLALNWREDLRYVFHRRNGKVTASPVRYGRGPLLEAVPRNQMLWDTNFLVGDAPCVVRELSMTHHSLCQLADNDPSESWYEDSVEAVKDHPGHEGPGWDVSKSRRVLDGASEAIQRPGPYETHDIREIHLDWPLHMYLSEHTYGKEHPEDQEANVGTVITIHRKTGEILRAIAEPYFFPYKPFFDIYYKKRTGRGHSVGVVKKLEHMQSAMTTQLNQSIDAMTRANSVWGKTRDRQHLDKPLDPRYPLFDPTGSFEPFTLPANTIDNQRNIQMVQVLAERLTGIADPALGRETRSGGHPQPATSTLALMAQSDIMTYSMRELIRAQMGRIGEAIASLYQQFETDDDGKLSRVLGDKDAREVSQYYFPTDPIIGNIQFDVVAMNESTNPDAEMQRAILVEQMNTNYWAKILKVLPMLSSPQLDSVTKKAIIAGVQAATTSHVRFLEASNVDDIERLIFEAGRAADANGRGMEAVTAQFGELAASAGVLPGQGMGGPAPGAGSGAPGPLGSIGQLQ